VNGADDYRAADMADYAWQRTSQPTPSSLLHCNKHIIACHLKLVSHPVLGGLHHEYERVPEAA
jgi:hypothetical protein